MTPPPPPFPHLPTPTPLIYAKNSPLLTIKTRQIANKHLRMAMICKRVIAVVRLATIHTDIMNTKNNTKITKARSFTPLSKISRKMLTSGGLLILS